MTDAIHTRVKVARSGVTVEFAINSDARWIAVLDASDVASVSGARGQAA